MGQDPQELRAQIEATREELGRDLDALADKANPKRIAHDQVDHAKTVAHDQAVRAREAAGHTAEQARAAAHRTAGQAKDNPAPLAAIAGGLAVLSVLVWLVRRRR